MLSSIDLQLNSYEQNYFIIIAAESKEENDLFESQKTLFDINEQIKKKIEISSMYFDDVKFLFVGEKKIYDPLTENETIIEFYNKESERSRKEPAIYVFARDMDGSERMLNSMPLKADLPSILKLISKHKARVFASSIQF